jgi:hypothetical protein
MQAFRDCKAFARSKVTTALLVASSIAVSALSPSTANATIMRYLAIEDLTRLSSDIFRGQVVSTDVFWNADHTRIYTAIQVRIHETFKGSTGPDQVVTVTQPGGEKDGIRMDYAGRPEFIDGEEVALFTIRGKNDDFIVVGLKQGKMIVERNEIVRDFSGIMLLDNVSGGKGLRPVTLKTARLTVDEFRNRIARAVNR